MKRIGCIIAALTLLLTLSACRAGGESSPTLRIGVALYQQEDTFIDTVARELQRVALEEEQARNVKINLYITDGKESQTTQNEQVDRFLERGYDVICVNIVDRTAAAVIIDKAQAAGVPVIFFNREPWRRICAAGSTPIMWDFPQATQVYCRASWCWTHGEAMRRHWIGTATA